MASISAAHNYDKASMELQTLVAKVDDSKLRLALLQRVRAQNKSVFAELYEQTFDRLYGLAYRVLDSRADTVEIVCELLVKV